MSAVLGPVLAVGVLAWSSHRTIALEVDGSVTHWTWWPWWVALPLALTGLVWVVRRLARRGRPGRARATGPEPGPGRRSSCSPSPCTCRRRWATSKGSTTRRASSGPTCCRRGTSRGVTSCSSTASSRTGCAAWSAGALRALHLGGLGSYSMVFAPLFWVLLYLLAIYAAPRGVAVPAGVVLLAASHLDPGVDPLGARRPGLRGSSARPSGASRRWIAGLTAYCCSSDAVLVPEVAFQVAACFAVLLLHDLAVRRRGVGWWRGPAVGADLRASPVGCCRCSGWATWRSGCGDGLHRVLPVLRAGPQRVRDLAASSWTPSRSHRVWMYRPGVSVIAARSCTRLALAAPGPLTPLQWTTLAAALLGRALRREGAGSLRRRTRHAEHQRRPAALRADGRPASSGGRREAVRREARRRRGTRPLGSPWRSPLAAGPGRCACWSWPWSSVGRPVSRPPGGCRCRRPAHRDPRGRLHRTPTRLDTVLLDDHRRVLDTYAGDGRQGLRLHQLAGLLLLPARGGSRPMPFVHISMAGVERAQQAVVDDLATPQPAGRGVRQHDGSASRPGTARAPRSGTSRSPSTSSTTGRPVVAADGVLFMVRDDLLADAPRRPSSPAACPTPPTSTSPSPTCDWGYSANYLESDPRGTESRAAGAARSRGS